ncbi:hypothetical protein ACEPAI_3995 [Sanghuangporus weigelae]
MDLDPLTPGLPSVDPTELDPIQIFLGDESGDDEEDEEAASVLLAAMEDVRLRKAEFRAAQRSYLVCADLHDDPAVDSAWQKLFAQQNDRAFINVMGVDCATFNQVIASGFAKHWRTTPIRRTDVDIHGAPRNGRRSLGASGALGLILHYLNSSAPIKNLQQIFALIPATADCYIHHTLTLLLKTLRRMPETKIKWPSGAEFEDLSQLVHSRHERLHGTFGFIDGLNLPVQESHDPDIENATYNGWLHAHFISNVFVFSPKGTIIACCLNAPGSWHDSRIADVIYAKLRDRTPEGYFLVADSAFPKGTSIVARRIRSAPKKGQKGARYPRNPERREAAQAYNRQLISCRQAAEWGMCCLQGSFARLRMPLNIGDGDARLELLETCVRLHNLRTNLVGINQIQNTFEPIWKHGDGLWEQLGDALLTEIQVSDRVLRFYNEHV